MKQLEKTILRTLAYADIFDYPLTFEELHRFLIGQKIDKAKLRKLINQASKIEQQAGRFHFFKNRKSLVSLRNKREKWSRKKITIAKRTASWLKLIPSIKMVALTGSLTMKNSDKNDDIDLLIVTRRNRLWLTRLLTVFLIELVAKRRRPKDKQFEDKICLNMFLDEDHLKIPYQEQDLFTAHEACQLMPLWEKEKVYQKFLKENQWVKKFLPNWKP